jgi:hypothetical protein
MRIREAQNIPTYPTDTDQQLCWIPFAHLSFSYLPLIWSIYAWGFYFYFYFLCGQVGSVLVLRDPAVLVTLKMEYVNITLNNILSIYRSEPLIGMIQNTTVQQDPLPYLLTPWSKIRDRKKKSRSGIRIRDEHPGSYFRQLRNNFLS